MKENREPVFLEKVLDTPSYGFEKDGQLYIPTHAEILVEFFSRLNVFKSKKNWLSLFSWAATLSFAPFFFLFFLKYFTWPLFWIGFTYSMVVLGTHGTIYLHRYATHHAFSFRNRFWLFLCRNLVIKIIPEEVYVVSHHVHHYRSEQPGDPYNAHGGWLYCFLADVNHQSIARDFSERDYARAANLVRPTGIRVNSYAQYQKWGSICHPSLTFFHFFLNWAFWYGAFYLIGGNALAVAIFGMTAVWAIGIRTFNYTGHGGGKDRRKEGVDFYRKDYSLNQWWPGMITGEWHNNHHLFPNGVRAGFLPYQWDFAWYSILLFKWMGGVHNCRDYKERFYKEYYEPYQLTKKSVSPIKKGFL